MRDQSTPPFLLQQLADAVDTVSTGPFGSLLHKKDYVANAVPVLNPINIGDGIVTTDFSKCVTEEKAQELKAYRLKRGDILVGRRGDIGRCGVVGKEHEGALCGTGCFFVRCGSKVDADFLALQISAPAARERLLHASTGATMANLSNTSLKSLPIWIPPLFEQKRIVAVLDEAFEGLARARALAEVNLQNAQELFLSLVDYVFQEVGPETERPISEIGRVFDGPHATPKTVESGPVFLGISSLVDGRVELTKTRHVTEDDFAIWTRRVVPQAGDVVFAYETRLGQVALIPEGMRCCLGRRMGLLRVNRELMLPEFFVLAYLSPRFQTFLKEKTVKGATVDRIMLKQFPSFPFPAPPLEMQRRIIARVAAARSKQDELVALATQKLQDLDDLRQSLLRKAFAGELT